jgi:hypothetical protein
VGVDLHPCKRGTRIQAGVSMRVSWCLCMCISGSVCVDAHVCTFVSLYLGACPYVCMCKRMSQCTCVCVRARER